MTIYRARFSSSHLNWGAIQIAGLYLLIGCLWILFSDQIAASIAPNKQVLTTISLYKGWGYVIVTALLLYWLLGRHTAALRASEEQLLRVIDSLPALISYVDANRCYQFINQTYEKWFGSAVQGKHIEEVLGASAYRAISKYIDKALSGETVNYEAEIPLALGDRFVNATYVPDIGPRGKVKGFFALVHDMTAQKDVQDELRLWADAFEGCAHGVAIGDPMTNRIVVCNPAFAGLHRSRVEDVVGSAFLSLYAPSDQEYIRRQLQKADRIGHSSSEVKMIRRDGSALSVQMDVVSVSGDDGELLYRVVTAQDISERKAAEDALRLKDQLLHMTSEMAKVGGWEFDPSTGKGTWTDEVARIHDLDPDQETSVELGLSFYVGDSRQIVEQAVREAAELGKPYDLELEMVSAKGIHKWVRTMALPIVQENRVVRVQGIFQDITGRKQIEAALLAAHDELELKVQERTAALSEANALLEALMDHMPDHIYFKDTQSRFIRSSRSQTTMLGLDNPAEAIGKTDFDYFPHAARAYAEEQEVMRSGKALIDVEEWVVWPDRRETWVSTTKVPLRNSEGQTIGIFGISRDITERKKAEQAIHQLNEDLEKQAAELQAANQELEAFSYSVSHDLRAPLRAIDGYTRILLEDYEANLDSEGRRVCNVISTEARRMGQLIDNLLSFSRLGRKEMFTSKIDMRTLALSVFDELAKEEDRKRIDLRIAKLPSARGDLSLMRQVWVNLLSNAIKFTSKKERAVVEVGARQGEDENVYFVRDTGTGFDMEYANKLFGVFQRLHSESEFEGTGVGLAIVQRIIHRHGGRVWAEGSEGKGATFYFALPKEGDH